MQGKEEKGRVKHYLTKRIKWKRKLGKKKKQKRRRGVNERKKKKGGERTTVKESKADKLRKTHNGFQLTLLVIHVHLNVEIRKKYFCKFFFPSFSLFVNKEKCISNST